MSRPGGERFRHDGVLSPHTRVSLGASLASISSSSHCRFLAPIRLVLRKTLPDHAMRAVDLRPGSSYIPPCNPPHPRSLDRTQCGPGSLDVSASNDMRLPLLDRHRASLFSTLSAVHEASSSVIAPTPGIRPARPHPQALPDPWSLSVLHPPVMAPGPHPGSGRALRSTVPPRPSPPAPEAPAKGDDVPPLHRRGHGWPASLA